MGRDEYSQTDGSWPEHFQPRPGQEAILTVSPDERIGTSLLDLFYFRPAESRPASLIAIVGCMGATISAVGVDDLVNLPGDVRDEVQMCRVNQRNRFRMITAPRIDVFKLEALRLNVSGPGFNDPVQLFGAFQARISCRDHHSAFDYVQNEGRMTVGRIDLLHSIQRGIERPLVSAGVNSTSTYHALIPTSGGTDNASPMMLLYPLADPDLGEIADNEAIFRHAIYRLLTSLQGDMRKMGLQTRFAENRLPVPDRAQFIEELIQDGYEIRGNTAYKTDRNRAPQSTTILGQFKRSVESWFAPAIGLPLEASLIDYGALIDEAISQIATHDDRKAMRAVKAIVADGYSPATANFQAPPVAEAAPGSEPQRTQGERTKPTRAMSPMGDPPVTTVQSNPWRDDFARETLRKRSLPQRLSFWWDDFADDTHSSVTVRLNGNSPAISEMETSDFRDFSAAQPARDSSTPDEIIALAHQTDQGGDSGERPGVQAPGKPSHSAEWKGDFE